MERTPNRRRDRGMQNAESVSKKNQSVRGRRPWPGTRGATFARAAFHASGSAPRVRHRARGGWMRSPRRRR